MFKLILRMPDKVLKRFISTESPSSTISSILKLNKVNDNVEIKGWIKSLRNQKENVFIDVSDGSTDKKLQIFIPKKLKPNTLSTGSSIIASGSLNLSPKNQLELHADNIKICGDCVISNGYPFAPRKAYTSDYTRQHLNFRPRTNKFSSLLRIRSAATSAINQHLINEGFINIHTPILTSNDCEGAGEVFKVIPESRQIVKSMMKEGQNEDEAYFNSKTYLTVSGQMHLEAAAHGLSRVYTLGPTFRAENSKSRLHLSEFYMLEAEIAFMDRIEELTGTIEKLIRNVTTSILESNSEDVDRCREDKLVPDWLSDNTKFTVISYEEASRILENKAGRKPNKNEGFSKDEEMFLVKQNGNCPIFVINWPKDIKPFYMKEMADGRSVAALDLLGPNVGEIVGGSLREDNYQLLEKKLPKNHNLSWYLNLRKFGGVPTAGYGLGFERYLQFILGINNIKDTIPFPRWPHNCSM